MELHDVYVTFTLLNLEKATETKMSNMLYWINWIVGTENHIIFTVKCILFDGFSNVKLFLFISCVRDIIIEYNLMERSVSWNGIRYN